MNRANAFTRFIGWLEQHAVNYCLLGDTSGFPETISGDVDIATDRSSARELTEMLWRLCDASSARLIQLVRTEQTAWYFVLAWPDEQGRMWLLAPDFCTDFRRDARLFLRSEELLAGRRRAQDPQGRAQGFYVAAPAVEFIYYFLKCVEKLTLDARRCEHLTTEWRKDPGGCRSKLEAFWPYAIARTVATAAECNVWNGVASNLAQLRRSLHQRRRIPLSGYAHEFALRLGRLGKPPGLSVGIAGSSAEVQASVAAELERGLAAAFLHVRRLEVRDFLEPGSRSSTCREPHEQQRLTAVTGIIGRLWQCAALRWRRLPIELGRATLVIFEGCAPLRGVAPYGFRVGPRVARLAARLLPEPEFCILLDDSGRPAPGLSAVSQTGEGCRPQKAYPARGCKCHIFVEANQPVEQVHCAVATAILDYLAERLERRLGLVRHGH